MTLTLCRGPIALKSEGLRAIHCQACGYVHLWPLPTPEDLDALYQREYYEAHNVGWFEKEAREQWYWERVYWRRIETARALVGRADMRTFDYGAGCGWFVRYANEAPMEAIGFEPSPYAREWAREKLGVHLFDWDALALAYPGAYDFVHASLVLEHLLHPRQFLAEAHHALSPGGALCIVVPSEMNPLQVELKRRYGYSPLHQHHVNYFTRQAIEALVQEAGFEVARSTSTFPMEWWALHGLPYPKYPKLGKVAHALRMWLEWTMLVYAPDRWDRMRDGWAAKNWGREVELWAKKPNGS
ncbi:MAG: class I SAM-dependent methyltransferase [Gammaproteobacteria bacterium]|nr:class I SAM-dependent methyltransferase [Gammaproteobacteria bacterium]